MKSYWIIEERLKGAKDWQACTNNLHGKYDLELLKRYKTGNPHREFRITVFEVARTIYDDKDIDT